MIWKQNDTWFYYLNKTPGKCVLPPQVNTSLKQLQPLLVYAFISSITRNVPLCKLGQPIVLWFSLMNSLCFLDYKKIHSKAFFNFI